MKMFQLAENLGRGYSNIRVDFYTNGQVYFGVDFLDASGFDKIIPDSYDLKFENGSIFLTREDKLT